MLDERGLDLLFRQARSHNAWLDRPVSEAQLRALYEILKWGPTTTNSQPARFLFLRAAAEKDKLAAFASPANQPKIKTAPVVAIVAFDLRFYENLGRTFPHNQAARSWFEGKDQHIATTALRNGSLQGAYMIVAARAIGLDCGPMSGFDNAKVDAAFFPDGRFKSNFICGLGYGDPAKVMPRNPRLEFDEVCKVV
ncbi:MAG: malonic semialdehyde reductase [Alphaproteobacteria bacterium]|nr:malonic semialdehyde reductase [Alphaproteobacteria bacterium]